MLNARAPRRFLAVFCVAADGVQAQFPIIAPCWVGKLIRFLVLLGVVKVLLLLMPKSLKMSSF